MNTTTLLVSGKNYELVRKIGSGAFGDVYLARDESRRELAIKTLRIQPSPSHIASFKGEFLLLTQLKHPSLCPVHDFAYSETLKSYLFISDYAPGQPFFEATEGKSPEEVEGFAIQVLEVLDYLHLHGVIHFDIKCPNILVGTNGRVKLLDFGFAHLQSDPLMKFSGSLRYTAPEILAHSRSADHRADLYSFGIVLHRALTRHYSFPENDMAEIAEWHRHKSVIWTEEECRRIPLHLRRLTEFLLKKNPAERLSRAQTAINWINLHTENRYGSVESRLVHSIPAEGHLVARDEALSLALEALSSPSGTIFSLIGERGIGKSRLLREIKYTAEVKEFHCLWLDDFHRKGGVSQLTEQLNLPALRSPDVFFHVSDEKIRDKAPAAIFIDDLQEADPYFWEWVARVSDRRSGLHLFLGWEGLLPESGPLVPLFRHEKAFPLARLTRDDVGVYLAEVIPEKKEEWIEPLYEFSSGIPLLVTEGARYLLAAKGDKKLPSSIEKLYESELLDLPEPALQVLETLALWRSAPTLDDLSASIPMEVDRIAPLIPYLLSRGLVGRVSPLNQLEMRYRISNMALTLVLRARPEKNNRFRRILGRLETEENVSLEDLAFFAEQAKEKGKARLYLSRLAENQEGSFQTQKAIGTYRRLLRLAEGERKIVASVRKKLIPLLVLAGRPDDAIALFPEDGELGPADRKLKGWVLARSGRFREAETLYQQGLLESTEEDPLHRELLNDLANVYVQTNEVGKALCLFQRTLPPDSMNDDEKLKTLKSNNLGLALALSGKIDEALKFETEKLALFKKEGNEHHVASILSQLGFIELKGQNLLRATLYFEEALVLSERLGDLHNILILLDNLIIIFQKRGLYHEALRAFSKAVNYRSAVSPPYQIAQNYLKGAFLYLTIGLPELAKSHLDRIDTLLNDVSSPALRGWTELAWGYYDRAVGLAEEAARHFRESITISDHHQEASLHGWGYYALADLRREQKKGNEASDEYRHASENLPQLADEELRLRMKLLSLLLQKEGFLLEEADQKGPLEGLKRLGEECESKGMMEIAAEAYLAAHDRRAKILYLEIASHLPEEFKIAYESERLRQVEREFG